MHHLLRSSSSVGRIDALLVFDEVLLEQAHRGGVVKTAVEAPVTGAHRHEDAGLRRTGRRPAGGVLDGRTWSGSRHSRKRV